LTDTPPFETVVLDNDWRTTYPEQLEALAEDWRSDDAWQGMTRAGGWTCLPRRRGWWR
jgi:hypothetical protein